MWTWIALAKRKWVKGNSPWTFRKYRLWLLIVSCLNRYFRSICSFQGQSPLFLFSSTPKQYLVSIVRKTKTGVEDERNTTRALCIEQSGHLRDIFIIFVYIMESPWNPNMRPLHSNTHHLHNPPSITYQLPSSHKLEGIFLHLSI